MSLTTCVHNRHKDGVNLPKLSHTDQYTVDCADSQGHVFRFGINTRIVGKCDPQKLSWAGAWQEKQGTFADLAAHHAAGYPWMPALLDGNRKRWQSNANYAEVIAADIDGGMAIEDAIAHPFISQHCGLGIESSSSSPERHKFRLVFRLPHPVTTWKDLRLCNRYLIHLIGTADPACKDASRYFFGGKGRSPFILRNEAVLPPSFIEDAIAWDTEQLRVAELEAQKALERRRQYAPLSEDDELRRVEDALGFAPVRSPGCGNYSECVSIAAGLRNTFGDATAIALLNRYIPPHYASGDTWNPEQVVRGLGRAKTPRPATLGTVFHICKVNGWRPPQRHQMSTARDVEGGDRQIPPHIRGLQRRADLHIGDREFSAAVERWPRRGIVALHGSTGTGKGEAIANLLQNLKQPWLSFTTLRSLARDQAAGWDGVVVNQGDRVGSQLLRNGQPVLGGVVCVPSILATRPLTPRVLILDELPATQDFLLNSKLANKRGIRPLLLEETERRIREADLVVVASADLTEASLAWVESIRGERAFLVQSDRQPLGYDCHQIQGSKNQAIGDYIEAATEAHQAGKITIFHSDSKAIAVQVAGLLTEQGLNPLLITADTSGGDVESSFLSSKGLDLPALLAAGVGAIVTSPSVKEGFSIQHNTCIIDSVWGVFDGGSITAEAIAQTLDRIRSHTIPRYIWIAERGRAYSNLSKEESITAFIKEFRKASTDTLRLARLSLRTEADLEAGKLDWESSHINLLASIETERNRGMRALRARVETILKGRGKKISPHTTTTTPDQAKGIGKRLQSIRSQQQVEWAIAIEAAPDITEAEAKSLEEKDNRKPEEQHRLERYYLKNFYRIEKITADDALWDREGDRRKQIRHLERVLNPSLATTATADSINQNATTPQDWHRGILQSKILEESGAAALIRDIWTGDVVDLEAERVGAIAQWLKDQAVEFNQAFRFSNAQAVSDRQLVSYLLDWVGITRKVARTRVNGTPTRRYFVDQGNLEKLKSVVERREKADPPPQSLSLIEGGGSLAEWADLPPDCAADLTEMWLAASSIEEKQAVLMVVAAMREELHDGAIAA